MANEIELIRLRHENRRLWDTRLCWDNGVRICDTDRGKDMTCGKPATQLWVDSKGDDFFFCGDECREYVLLYQGGKVVEIGKAHGFTVYAFTPEPEDPDDEQAST